MTGQPSLAWSSTAAATVSGAYLLLTLLLALRYLGTRRPHHLWWALALGLLALQGVAGAVTPASPPTTWMAVRNVALMGAALMLFATLGRPEHAASVAGASIAAAIALGWSLARPGSVWGVLPPSAVAAALLVAAALRYPSAGSSVPGPGRAFVSWGLLLAASAALIQPFHRPDALGGALGGTLLLLPSLLLGAGLLLHTLTDGREMEAMDAIAATLNRVTNVKEATRESLRLVAGLLGIESGWVFLLEGGGHVLAASLGLPEALAARSGGLMTGECTCLRLLAESRLPGAVNIVDCQRLHRAGVPHGRHACVKLRAGEKAVGLMNLVLPGGRTFTDRELQTLSAVGHQIGLAVERGQLCDDIAAKERTRGELLEKLMTAHEDERRRIARELHDEAGQALTALIVNLELAAQEPSPDRIRSQLVRLRELSEQTLGEIRRLIHDLRPSILDDLGLAAALRWYAKSLLDPKGIAWTLTVSGLQLRLPPALETVAFRVVQEALTNVLRHSHATRVAVSVAVAGRELSVHIEDNGQGFDTDRAATPGRHGGFGLLGMRERVELVGGRWEVESTPGEGTVVRVTLPIHGAGVGI